MGATKAMYPQDTEDNEYRYLDFCWLDAMARGLTAGAEKHPGETWRQIQTEEHAARAAQKKLRGFPTSRDALAVCREVRRFFLSAYFGNLTKLDGRLLREQLDKEAEA